MRFGRAFPVPRRVRRDAFSFSGDALATVSTPGAITFSAAVDLLGVADVSVSVGTPGAITFSGASGLAGQADGATSVDTLGGIAFSGAASLNPVAGDSASVSTTGRITFGRAASVSTFPSIPGSGRGSAGGLIASPGRLISRGRAAAAEAGGDGGVTMVRRLVGTKNIFPNRNRISDGVKTSFNSRTYHWTSIDITDPQAVYVGFTNNSAGELNFANAVTYRTAIELPSGTIQGLTKGGSQDHVVSPGDTFNTSDIATGFTIPAGGFWIRVHGFVSSGQTWPYTDYFRNNEVQDQIEEGSVSDKHLSGTITPVNQYSVAPVGLIGTVPNTQKLIVVLGDSISVAPSGGGPPINALAGGALGVGYGGGIGYMAMYLDNVAPYVQMGAPGWSAGLAKAVGAMTKRLATVLQLNPTCVWCNLGVNDVSGFNDSAATCITNLGLTYTKVRDVLTGIRIVQSTITPSVSPGASPVTDVSQTTAANVADDSLVDLNIAIRALGISGLSAYTDAALGVLNALDVHWWLAGTSNDGLHPNQTGGDTLKAYLQAHPPVF